MASFAEALNIFTDIGLREVLIPFLLTYAIVYGLLQKVNIFQKGEQPFKELNATLAIIIALGVVLSPTARTIITSITAPLAAFAIILFLLLIVMFSAGMKMKDIEDIIGTKMLTPTKPENVWFIILLGIGLIIILISVVGAFPDAIASNMDTIELKAAEMNISVNDYVNTLPVGQRVMFFLSLPQVIGLIVLIIIFVFAGIWIAA